MMSKSTKKSNDTIVETFKDIIPLSFGEEIGNAASHGVAALLTLLVLPYAAVHSYIAHGTLASVSMSIYVISIFMMFISSTIYHSMQNETPHKYILRIIDHSMIYVAISGTYTPILLTVVGGWIGWTVFILLWGTTLWGILYKSIAVKVKLNCLFSDGLGRYYLVTNYFYSHIMDIHIIHFLRWCVLYNWCMVLCTKE